MNIPAAADWSFAEIERQNSARATHLECVDPEQLILQIREALSNALRSNTVRFAIDSEQNEFQICRPIIQFPTSPQIVDAFFNSRVGYRAHYWMSPQDGIALNSSLVELLRDCLDSLLPQEVEVRKVAVHSNSDSRDESDVGSVALSKLSIVRALDPFVSKLWLCERLVQQDGAPPKDTGLLLSSIFSAKLRIPKWEEAKNPISGVVGEGLRAPFPTPNQAWLDIKGGFTKDSEIRQLKAPLKRAQMIWSGPLK